MANVHKYALFLIYITTLLLFFDWLSPIKNQAIDLDELAWVNDSQVYEWRKNQDWQNFNWSSTAPKFWSSPDFRLFDQPHLVKYIYGSVFSFYEAEPWKDIEYHQKNYLQFTQGALSGKKYLYDEDSQIIFGEKTIGAITIAREISRIFAILFILIISLFIAKNYSFFQATIVSFLIVTNTVFQHNLKLATADSISMFFILLALICLYFLYKKNESKSSFLLIFLSSMASSLASSSKINGWILVFIFNLLFLIKEKENNKKMWQKIFIWNGIYFGTYIYLQPELWQNIIGGFVNFFSQRIEQQRKFLFSNKSYNFLEYHFWLIKLFISSANKIFTLTKTFIFITTLFLFLMKVNKNIIFKLSSPLLWILSVSWVFFFFYAQVGFERYAMWPLLILFLISANLLEKIKNNANKK